jgi:hypothetical protein
MEKDVYDDDNLDDLSPETQALMIKVLNKENANK